MKKAMITFSTILLFFLLLGTTYATDIENENSTSEISENISIESYDLDMNFLDGSQFKIKLIGDDVYNKTVILNIVNKNYIRQTNEEGEAFLNIRLNPGQYNIVTSVGNSTKTNIITVHKNKTILETQNNIDLVFKNGFYTVKLKDQTGNPLVSESVNIKIIGKTYTKTTDENGNARLNINLSPGVYTITAEYLENSIRLYSTVTSTINVFSTEQCKIIANNYVCDYKKGVYQVKLLSENNLPIQNAAIDLNIVGKTYTKTTDENGIARLNINLNPGSYPISYKLGSLYGSKTISVNRLNASVHCIDMNVSYEDHSYFSIELTDNGTYLADKSIKTEVYQNNKLVKTYSSRTFDNGIAKFEIDLKAGEYIFKTFSDDTMYQSNYCENIVKIRKSNVTAKSQDLHLNRIGEYYTVTLRNNETQLPIVNEKVIIHVVGKDYIKYTDKNGEAKLKINLNEGTYDISYKYEGNNGYNGASGNNIIIRDHKQVSTYLEVLNPKITRYEDQLIVKVTDENSIPLTNQPVTLTVCGKDYVKYTDEKGEAKLTIRLSDNKYDFKINFKGNELFKSSKVNFVLDVNKSSDFNYSFGLSKFKEFDGKYPLIRYIDLIYQDKTYKYSTKTTDYPGILLSDNSVYFLSFDYKTSTKLSNSNQIKGQGISIEVLDDNFTITYYGKLSNITQFNVVYDQYEDERFYGKTATIIVNNKIEAKIVFSEYMFSLNDFYEILDKNYDPFISEIEDMKTTLNALGFSHNKTIQLDYYNNFKTVQSYLISASKINSEYVHSYLENYVASNFNYDLQAQENSLISLYTLWASQRLDDILADNLNCTWQEESIVLTTTEWYGMSIHSTYSLDIKGNETSKWTFKNLHGYLFSYCEQLALESAGIEAKSATSEIFEGLNNGELAIFDSKNDTMVIRVTNSTSEIVINTTTGNTNCLLGTDINNIINNFKYKGGASENHVDHSYPKELVNEYGLIYSSFDSNLNNIFSNETEKGIRRYVFNEIRTHKDKVLASIQSVLVYISPKSGGLIFGTLQAMIYIGEYTVDARNMYAPSNTFQYFSYHPAIWDGKTITILDRETGQCDYVEIPYKKNGELDIEHAIYIEGESGARNLTEEEVELYGDL